MNWSAADYQFMARALHLAGKGRYNTPPNPRVGCVIVRDEVIIAEGWHALAGGPHAEVMAIESTQEDLHAAHCYLTLEPCSHYGKTPPCVDSLVKAGIATVTVAMQDPNPLVAGQGMQALAAANIACREGLLKAQALRLNPGFIKRMHSGLPYVRSKLATSLDGGIALNNGNSQWISSEHSRQDGQHWRASSSAILTSVETVLADNPRLTVRSIPAASRQPLRVIVDSHLRTPPDAKMFAEPGASIIFAVEPGSHQVNDYDANRVEVVLQETDHTRVDLAMVLKWLAEHKQVNEVLVEAGGQLNGALFAEHLIDEFILYQAPVIFGHGARPMFTINDLVSMDEVGRFELIDQRMFAQDQRKIFKLSPNEGDS